MAEKDPFEFLLKASVISRPQMELLRTCAFAREEQTDLLMFSMPETQRAAAAGVSGTQEQDDVFHTPPEKSSTPISGDMPPSQPCKLNHEALGFVDLVGSQGNGSVDLGRDSELGLSQEVEEGLVAQSSQGIKRCDVAEECKGFQRESVKKSKLSKPNSGLGIDVELGKVNLNEEQVRKDNEMKNSGYCSHRNKQGQKKNKKFVFHVLKFLAGNLVKDDDKKEEEEDATSEDVVNIGGINFPRPRWWRPDVCIKKL